MKPITFTRPQRGRILARARVAAGRPTLRELAEAMGAAPWELRRFLEIADKGARCDVLVGVLRLTGWTWTELEAAAGQPEPYSANTKTQGPHTHEQEASMA